MNGKRIRIHEELEQPTGYHCECCSWFNCYDCPIGMYSRSGCIDTPYSAASEAWDEKGIRSAEFKKAAQKEIDFLNEVLKAGIGE